MVPFWAALVFDLAAAVVLIASVARLFQGQGAPALLSYLFYLVSWYALLLFMLVFLFAPLFLPESAQRAYMLFNSIFVIPLNGLIAYFFADFTWKWLEKPMPRLLRFGLPLAFLAILFVYAREILGKLSAESQPQSFVLSAPASLALMFACLFLVMMYAAIAVHWSKDGEKTRRVRLFAAVTGGSLIIGLLFVMGAFSALGPDGQNAIGSAVLASANGGGWVFARGFFRGRARSAAAALARLDLSGLETRYGISPREREIISLMITGKSNREITEALYISQETVKKHIYNAYRKIGVKNRVQLMNAVLEACGSSSTTSE